MTNYLGYGAAGLALALAMLAFRLLSKEQASTRPRRNMLTATYVYLSFALVLALVGFGSEYLARPPVISEQVQELKEKLRKSELETERLKSAINQTTDVLSILNGTRGNAISHIEDVMSRTNADPSLKAFVVDLKFIHEQMRRITFDQPLLSESELDARRGAAEQRSLAR